MKVAIVHDWLIGMRGGEKVLEVLCELYPGADIYTLFYNPKKISKTINRMRIKTSFLQNFPFALACYRKYLPLFPMAVEEFDLRGYDLVISSSHCVAKGALTNAGTLHVCYCYTPLRYGWDMYHEYFGGANLSSAGKFLVRPVMNYLRLWDCLSSMRVDGFIAISKDVASRIKKHYRREAEIIYPPVNTSLQKPGEKQEDFFLVVSALVPYKRIDLAVDAFNMLGFPLRIVGQGPLEKKLRRRAKKNVEFMGEVDDEKLCGLYRGCRALIFPGIEDFGIAPVEAQAAGKPVIAYSGGGIVDTVIEGKTGLFFDRQTPASLADAVETFGEMSFSPETIRDHAVQFDRDVFKKKFAGYIEKRYSQWRQERK